MGNGKQEHASSSWKDWEPNNIELAAAGGLVYVGFTSLYNFFFGAEDEMLVTSSTTKKGRRSRSSKRVTENSTPISIYVWVIIGVVVMIGLGVVAFLCLRKPTDP